MATQVTLEDPTKARAYFEEKMAFTTGPVELERMMKSNAVTVVDVRAAEDFAEGHIPGAVNLPRSVISLRQRRSSLLARAILLWNWTVDGVGGRTTLSPSKRKGLVRLQVLNHLNIFGLVSFDPHPLSAYTAVRN